MDAGTVTAGRSGAGVPRIDFHAHLVRAGEGGASADFEQMLALLVGAIERERAIRIRPHPGDWGIDVLVGDLHDRAFVWQAKFFIREFGPSQCDQVRASFRSAMAAAVRLGYRIERWTLCVPCSMEGRAARWWQAWSARQRLAHDVRVDLWDQTELIRLLLRPEAEDVRHAFYDPYSVRRAADGLQLDRAPAIHIAQAGHRDAAAAWRGGDVLRFGDHRYLLLGDPVEERGSPRTREATADQIEPRTGGVWLRQVCASRERLGSSMERRERDGLRAQAHLLSRLEGVAGMPRLLALHDEAEATTLVVMRPPVRTWGDHFPSGVAGRDRLVAAAALAAALPLCAVLYELHRLGFAHGALGPAALLVPDRGGGAVLRDLGRAAVRPAADPPGPRTDILQLTAILYETFTGHPPSSANPMAVRAMGGDVPRELDDLLGCALDADQHRRPGTMREFGAGLRRARSALARGAGR
jgi:hypothetical protein